MLTLTSLTRKLISLKTTDKENVKITEALRYIQKFFIKADSHRLFESKILKLKKTQALFVFPRGVRRPEVLLVGHIDVMPADRKMFVPRVAKGKVFGRGAFDMKGPIAAMMCAMKDSVRMNPSVSVGLLVTSDEEHGGFDGMSVLISNKRFQPRLAIVPDGGSDFVCAKGGKGVGTLIITVSGSAAHSARPWEGRNAIMIAARILAALEKKYPGMRERYTSQTTISPISLRSTNLGGNVIPREVVIICNVRFTADFDFPELKGFIEQKFPVSIKEKKHAEPYDAHLESPLAQSFLNVIKKHTGQFPKKVTYPSTCDARFFAERGIPVIVTRPAGGGAHGDTEWISLRGLEKYQKILTNFLELVGRD